MNNTIKKLPNGDFEVVYDEESPRLGKIEMYDRNGRPLESKPCEDPKPVTPRQ